MMTTRLKIFTFRWAPAVAAALALVLQVWLLPASVSAGATTQPSGNESGDDSKAIKAWFVDLANSDPAVRSEALYQLMGLKADSLPLLKKVVEQSQPLLPAQASVLRQIVTQVFLSGEPYDASPTAGFLGIHMEPPSIALVSFRDAALAEAGLPNAGAANIGVVIVYRMPGFPAGRAFQDGDVILSILDRPDVLIGDLTTFMEAVKDMKAGDTVHFLILRHGQIIRVAVKLAPRPLATDNNATDTLKFSRQKRADDYWTTEFAALVKEAVS
jgi:hypothetical protein